MKTSKNYKKLFADFLKDGKYFNVQKNLDFKCSSCPTSNICVEQLMGQVDYHVQLSSMSSNNTVESKLLYVNNKTSEWFNNKSEEEKKKSLYKP